MVLNLQNYYFLKSTLYEIKVVTLSQQTMYHRFNGDEVKAQTKVEIWGDLLSQL